MSNRPRPRRQRPDDWPRPHDWPHGDKTSVSYDEIDEYHGLPPGTMLAQAQADLASLDRVLRDHGITRDEFKAFSFERQAAGFALAGVMGEVPEGIDPDEYHRLWESILLTGAPPPLEPTDAEIDEAIALAEELGFIERFTIDGEVRFRATGADDVGRPDVD